MGWYLRKYLNVFEVATMDLEMAFIDIFQENQMVLGHQSGHKKWIKKVQKALAKLSSAKVLETETRAFKFLRQNATEVNKILSDIQKLQKNRLVRLSNADISNEDSDEEKFEFDFEKEDEETQFFIEEEERVVVEVKRLVKVMGDFAVDLGADYWATQIQTLLYDMKKVGPQYIDVGMRVEVKLESLSEEQLKLTPLMNIYHLPPKKQGNGS